MYAWAAIPSIPGMRIISHEMRKIALCMELSDYYEHGIARGLVRYAKAKPDWQLYGYGWMFRPLSDLKNWKGDGIVARIESADRADLLASLDLPVVDVAGAYSRREFISVTNDDFLTGYKAGTHLVECGFSRFAFLGVKGTLWSERRLRGFKRALEEHTGGRASGLAVPVFERPLSWWERLLGENSRERDFAELSAFVGRLKYPTALFACNDTAGLRAIELAGKLGVDMPESLAILGVDNEDIICELASPSLSSVMLDCEAIGYKAAAVLDALLDRSRKRGGGSRRPSEARTEDITVPPKEIVERESTKVFACEDELVAKATTVIRARAHEGLDVGDLLGFVPASRRSLEKRFRAAMGRSIHEEILRARISYAKRLLRDTDDTLDLVSERSGFGAVQRFHEAFKRQEKMSPGAWRRKNRGR
jgi:LacI family transcriptional regulator